MGGVELRADLWGRRAGAVLVVVTLVVGLSAGPAHARKRFPPHLDPRSWVVPEDMSWGDYEPIPGVVVRPSRRM